MDINNIHNLNDEDCYAECDDNFDNGLIIEEVYEDGSNTLQAYASEMGIINESSDIYY